VLGVSGVGRDVLNNILWKKKNRNQATFGLVDLLWPIYHHLEGANFVNSRKLGNATSVEVLPALKQQLKLAPLLCQRNSQGPTRAQLDLISCRT
jgi:hypothetical protein